MSAQSSVLSGRGAPKVNIGCLEQIEKFKETEPEEEKLVVQVKLNIESQFPEPEPKLDLPKPELP